MESPRESLIKLEIFNNATILPDNSAANVTITTTNLPSEDNSAFTAGSTSIIKQRTAELHQHTLLSLSLKWPHGKRVASDEDSENLSSKKPLKNTGKAVKVGVEEHFSFDIGEDDFESFKKGECPANTAKSTKWAIKNFEMWRIARNAKFVNDQYPENWYADKENLCGWLCRFVAETRKANGDKYTPRGLYLLLAGLQRKIRLSNPQESVNIFAYAIFKELRNICDSVFKRLHQRGIGSAKSTKVLTQLEENKLWESGVLNLNTPIGLLRSVCFYNGKSFCLHGGQEQHGLKLSQIAKSAELVPGSVVNCYMYREFGSKNHQVRFSSLNADNKVVKQYENLSGSGPCHVKILDTYLSKLPEKAKENGVFYLTPLPKKSFDPTKPWYTLTFVGKNRLNGMLKEMCAEVGLAKILATTVYEHMEPQHYFRPKFLKSS